MDVILDSNVILEDAAFSRAQFRELLAYLKRTNSRLVLPTTVREEVEARFRERLSKLVSQARSAWEQVRILSGSDQSPLPIIDIDEAVESLRKRMARPAAGVPETVFRPLELVDVGEVVRRGINRRRPASLAGEQLRDVIVWLHVKQYAAEVGQQIGFVTNDEDFRDSKDSERLHPDLDEELKSGGYTVSFHRDIASFIRTHALTSRSIAEEWISRFVRVVDIRKAAMPKLLRESASYGLIQQAEIDSLDFERGTEFMISETSSYVEAVYDGTARVQIRPSILTINVSPGITAIESEVTYPKLYTNNAPSTGVIAAPIISSDDLETVYRSDDSHKDLLAHFTSSLVNDPTQNALGLNLSDSLFTQPFVAAKAVSLENRRCDFTLAVSGRVEGEKMIEWQVDELEIKSVSPA